MRSRRAVTLYFASIGVRQALALSWAVVSAPFVSSESRRARLHRAIARRAGGAGAFSYSSARGALSACLSAAGVGEGDEVLLSSYTCLAVPTGVLAAGATPTYCDVDRRTMNVTRQIVETSITPRTRAVVVQHTLGSAAPVDEIIDLARARGILVIEDCSLSIGTTTRGQPVGSLGDAAIYSLELSKTVSTGWGGILVVNSPSLAARVADRYRAIPELPLRRTLRMAVQTVICGICYLPRVFVLGKYVVYVGFKYGLFGPSTPSAEFEGTVASDFVSKLPGPQAALARHQWARFDEIAGVCAANGSRVRELLHRLGYVALGSHGGDVVAVSPRVPFLVADRATIISWFQREGIDLGSWFDGPLSPLPKARVFNYETNDSPNAVFLAKHVVNIPCHSRVSAPDLDRIERLMGEYAALQPEDRQVQRQLLTG